MYEYMRPRLQFVVAASRYRDSDFYTDTNAENEFVSCPDNFIISGATVGVTKINLFSCLDK